MVKQIVTMLRSYGYCSFDENRPGVYIRETEQVLYIVTLNRYRSGYTCLQNYENLQRQIEFMAATRYQKQVATLHIMITENGMFEQTVYDLLENMTNLWLVAKDTGRIYIFEKQLQDFDGLYEYLSTGLQYNEKNDRKNQAFQFTLVNMVIVAVNIMIYLGIILFYRDIYAIYNTDIMLKMGAMSYNTVMAGQWYQLITSMFLHFGFDHLLNNMILLAYVGCELERRVGKIGYMILYFFSGIIGNVASLLYYGHAGEGIVVSAGASGAIFGVIGALFVVLLVGHTKTEDLSPKRLLFVALITIYYGLTSVGVDNAAHIGGLFAGIIGGFLLSKISQYGKLV